VNASVPSSESHDLRTGFYRIRGDSRREDRITSGMSAATDHGVRKWRRRWDRANGRAIATPTTTGEMTDRVRNVTNSGT